MAKKGKQKLKQETIPEEPEEEDQVGFGGLGVLGDIVSDNERDRSKSSKKNSASVTWGEPTSDSWGTHVAPGAPGWGTGSFGAPTNPQPQKTSAWRNTNPQPTKSNASAWDTTTADDSWTHWNSNNQDFDEEEDDFEDDVHGFGTGSATNAGAWGQFPMAANWGAGNNGSAAPTTTKHASSTPRSGWQNWAEEAKKSSKVTYPSSNALSPEGVVTPQQRSQILEQLLNHPQNTHTSHHGAPQPKPKSKTKTSSKRSKSMSAADPWAAAWAAGNTSHPPSEWGGQTDNWGDGWGTGATGADSDFDDGGWGTNSNWDTPGSNGAPQPNWGSPSAQSKHSKVWGKADPSNSFPMPSKTLAHAVKGDTKSLQNIIGFASSKMDDYTNVHFVSSKGAALEPVKDAFFGTDLRLAKHRLHWLFSPNKDPRVAGVLDWIQTMSYGLGSYGLEMFLRTRERGALFTNVEFRMKENPGMPVFDWMSFDDVQKTKDRILQESIAFYDPAIQVIIFVFLPSKSGNSVAIWRRKIAIPNNARLMYQRELTVAKSGLRRDVQYVVHVDEAPPTPPRRSFDKGPRPKVHDTWSSSSSSEMTYPMKKKKKKKSKWWKFWRVDWE